MDWLFGNKLLFNYIILTLYCLNVAWSFWHGSKVDGCYWMSAAMITATVTFGYNH